MTNKAKPKALPRSEIVTHFVYPPIPIRQFDWSAVRDGYDGGDLIGRGETEAEAIADLLEQEDEQDKFDTLTCPYCQGCGFDHPAIATQPCRACSGSGELPADDANGRLVAGDSDQDKQDSPEGKL